MSSTNKTSIGLNQWVETDKPKMMDFNADNEIITEQILGKVDRTYVEEALEGKADRAYVEEQLASRPDLDYLAYYLPVNSSFVIGVSDWQESGINDEYPFQATIEDPSIRERDDAIVMMDLASLPVAQEAGIADGAGMTADYGITVLAQSLPESALSGTYTIIRRGEE